MRCWRGAPGPVRGDEAQRRYRQAGALAEARGDRLALSYGLRRQAGALEALRRLEEALALHRRCLALRREVGLLRAVPFALVAIADLRARQGAWGDAAAGYREALAAATTPDPSLLHVLVALGLARAAAATGDRDEARGPFVLLTLGPG